MIKVFQVDEATWMAAETVTEAVTCFIKDYDGDPEAVEEFGPLELTPEDLERLTIMDDDEPGQWSQTFAAALAQMIANGVEFPTYFASTEY